MAGSLNLEDRINEVRQRLSTPEQVLGKELIQPFPTSSSGSRKIMYSVHSEQAMALCNPEVPFIQTGFENEYGRRSTSFQQAEQNKRVLDKVEKYGINPGHEYYLIVYNEESNTLDLIHKCDYKYITESFGYQINNSYLDSLAPGSIIEKDTVISKSKGFDKYNNRMDGINVLLMYMAQNKTTEDAIEISESCAKKFRSPLVKKISFMINENDILLNLYGNDAIYKVIPDIGEKINDGILAAVRRENKEEALFSQVYSKLKDINMSDEKITSSGTVVGIEVRTNNPDLMETSIYNTQLNMYYQDKRRFCEEMISKVNKLKIHYQCELSYDLQKMVYTCQQVIDGVKYDMDSNVYSNLQMDVYVLEENELNIGDKLTNRYGGKGVISSIIPDELMPQTEDGQYVEMKYNQATVVNRLNPSQLFEMEINSASASIIRNLNKQDVNGSLEKLVKFTRFFSPTQADEMENFIRESNPSVRAEYLNSIIEDGNLTLSILPIQEATNIDVLREVLHEFPETKHRRVLTPMLDSTGTKYRLAKSLRPVLVAKQYICRLKQYAEEKFSATSMSFSNNRGENSRNKNSGLYKPVYTNTPIRQGEMEIGALTHIGDDINVIMLMLYSTAPIGRRAVKELLTGNPNDINIVLTDDAKSRSAEIVNTYLKSIGLRLVFEKVPKKLTNALLYNIPDEDFYVPAFLKEDGYLGELNLNNDKNLKITVKKINGKYYPQYKNFKEPCIPAIMTGAMSSEQPEGFDDTDPFWMMRDIKYFNK